MKRLFTLIAVFACLQAASQTTLVAWNFPNNPDDATADGGTTVNNAQAITAVGTATPTFSVSGITTNAASATGWNGGSATKYWEASFSTAGYAGITLSSKQRASGTGPADFKIQYKVGSGGTYADVTGGTVTVADNWTAGVVTNLALPGGVSNKPAVYIRWIMTSNNPVSSGSSVANGGTSRIDDIVVQAATTVPLPLKLLSFGGARASTGVMLRWAATCETDLAKYAVEKSLDGKAFQTIADFMPRNAGCGAEAVYSYVDGLCKGSAVYRLKITDLNGDQSFSSVLYFHGDENDAVATVAPNPATDKISVTGLHVGTQWILTDLFGRTVRYGIVQENEFSISIGDLCSGVYFLNATGTRPIHIVRR